MRTVGVCQKALDMMCERALSRQTQGTVLADKQSVQNYVADSYAQLMQFRLFVLYVAWEIDQYQDYRKVRHDIAAVKVLTAQVLHDIVQRSIQVHGALGVSNELPLGRLLDDGPGHGPRRRPERGPPRDRGPTDPEALPGGPRARGRPSTCPRSSPRRGPSSPSTSSTRSPTSERHDATDATVDDRPSTTRRVPGARRPRPSRALLRRQRTAR